MLKEARNVVYLLTIFFAIFFVTKFYLSENNIKRSNHQKELANKFSDLPIIKSDTSDIIEHTNEVEIFLSKKPRFFMNLIKDNRFDIIENTNEVEEFNYLNKLL